MGFPGLALWGSGIGTAEFWDRHCGVPTIGAMGFQDWHREILGSAQRDCEIIAIGFLGLAPWDPGLAPRGSGIGTGTFPGMKGRN